MVHATVATRPKIGWAGGGQIRMSRRVKERRNGTVALACFEGKLLGGAAVRQPRLIRPEEGPSDKYCA
jgi:hypothetical protein